MKEQLAFGNFDNSHSRNEKDKYLRRGLSADPVQLKKITQKNLHIIKKIIKEIKKTNK